VNNYSRNFLSSLYTLKISMHIDVAFCCGLGTDVFDMLLQHNPRQHKMLNINMRKTKHAPVLERAGNPKLSDALGKRQRQRQTLPQSPII